MDPLGDAYSVLLSALVLVLSALLYAAAWFIGVFALMLILNFVAVLVGKGDEPEGCLKSSAGCGGAAAALILVVIAVSYLLFMGVVTLLSPTTPIAYCVPIPNAYSVCGSFFSPDPLANITAGLILVGLIVLGAVIAYKRYLQ